MTECLDGWIGRLDTVGGWIVGQLDGWIEVIGQIARKIGRQIQINQVDRQIMQIDRSGIQMDQLD